jgi:hypothetical protein
VSGRTKDGKSLRFLSFNPESFPHGTVARYVAKCRCGLCKKALRERARERAQKVHELAASITPNGPPGSRILVKPSKVGTPTKYRIKTCPGTEGRPCVRGGAWLKDKTASSVGVCLACIDRAMVWNGNVSAEAVRKHLLRMRRKGIGYKTVAGACDVAPSLLGEIITGKVAHIRYRTEQRVLAVDEGCRTDGCRVAPARTQHLVEKILAKGFTQTWLSRELGCSVYIFSRNVWKNKRSVKASTALKVEKLWRRIKRGECEPRPRWVDAAPTWRLVRRLLTEGFTMAQLGERLNYPIQAKTFRIPRIRPDTAEKVERFHRMITAEATADESRDLCEPTKDDGWKRRLVDAYRDGVPVNELALRFGKEPSHVSQILHRAGVTKPKREQEEDADAA